MLDDWEKQYEEECKRNDKRARELFPLYENKKKLLESETLNDVRVLVYEDWVKETDDEIKTKTSRFTIPNKKKAQWGYHSFMSTSQKFLCVNGPLVGQKITDTNEDYVGYNCASFGRSYHREPTVPRVVLVHKSAFGAKK